MLGKPGQARPATSLPLPCSKLPRAPPYAGYFGASRAAELGQGGGFAATPCVSCLPYPYCLCALLLGGSRPQEPPSKTVKRGTKPGTAFSTVDGGNNNGPRQVGTPFESDRSSISARRTGMDTAGVDATGENHADGRGTRAGFSSLSHSSPEMTRVLICRDMATWRREDAHTRRVP